MITNTGLGFDEVEEGNKTISNFINLQKEDTMGGFRYLYRGKESTDLFFHSSSEWLLPVLDCIERFGYDTSIIRKKIDGKVVYMCKIKKETETELICDVQSNFKITAIWLAVIKFCRDPKTQELKPKLKIK